ncbi:MAG: trypsin-like peptidase domain-containing protein [Burkholderiaceae bacterium]|jgi:serine protease DegQ
MFKKLWLIFAQTATVCIAALFVLSTLRPEWISLQDIRGMWGIQASEPPVAAAQGGPTYSAAARRAMPAVVNIFTSKAVKPSNNPLLNDPLLKKFFGDSPQPEEQRERNASLGSGVIASAEGFVLTNQHVIEAADEIEVALADGRQVVANLVGVDPETDLAVLKINLPDLPVMPFAQAEMAVIGDVVLAIGNPFGVGQTVTMGIISALGRNHLGINTFENFIQTDAAINPGNSGGALVDAHGKLIGINTAIYSRTGGSMGIGFAIPVSTAKQVMDQIIATGSVTRGYIGVEPQDITPDLMEAFKLPRLEGVIVAGVMRDGPADRSGVKPGDILLSIDSRPVKDTTDLLNTIAQLKPGAVCQLRVSRNGKPLLFTTIVAKRPSLKKLTPLNEEE